MELVQVGRFLDSAEAHMAKGMLEANGIECFLEGEYANAVYPMTLRVRLKVRPADEADAQMLLMETESDE